MHFVKPPSNASNAKAESTHKFGNLIAVPTTFCSVHWDAATLRSKQVNNFTSLSRPLLLNKLDLVRQMNKANANKFYSNINHSFNAVSVLPPTSSPPCRSCCPTPLRTVDSGTERRPGESSHRYGEGIFVSFALIHLCLKKKTATCNNFQRTESTLCFISRVTWFEKSSLPWCNDQS